MADCCGSGFMYYFSGLGNLTLLKAMNDYKSIFPDPASEKLLVAVLEEYYDEKKLGSVARIPPKIKAGLEKPSAKYVFDNKEVFCNDYSILNNAARLDCVSIFKLWIEAKRAAIKKDDTLVTYYIDNAITYRANNIIRYLVPLCTNINHAPSYPYCGTVLYDAIVNGNKEAVKAIVAHPDVDLEKGSNEGVSPLAYALDNLRAEIAGILIKAGAKLTERIIIDVCQDIDKDIVNMLVRYLKNPNIMDPQKGITPLHAAIAAGNSYAVEKLLLKGAKTDIPSTKKYTKDKRTYESKIDAVKYAAILGDKKIKAMLKTPPKKVAKPAKHTPTSSLKEYKEFFPNKASEQTLIKTLKRWHKLRIDQERTDKIPKEIEIGLQRPDPRYVYDNMEVFCNDYFIMSFGAMYDCVPLFRMKFEKLKNMKFTLDKKAIPVEYFISNAAMHDAANVIRYLNPYAKNINYTNDSNRCTALHWAAQGGEKNAVKALLEHPGINLEARDQGGVTPLVRAFYSSNSGIAKMILEKGAALTAETLVALCLSYSVSIDTLAPYVKDFNVIDRKKGITPLQAAIAIENDFVVSRLIEFGAKTNILSHKKYTRNGKTYPAKIDAKEYAKILGNKEIKKIVSGK